MGNDGAAGGHGTMAGARLYAKLASADALATAFDDMVRRLLVALGYEVTPGEPLLRPSPIRNMKTWTGRAPGTYTSRYPATASGAAHRGDRPSAALS